MLDELLATPGVEERSVLRSRVGFLAPHGGLERATAEIAELAADAADASFYAVVQPPDFRWHVPSHRFDPSHSDALAAFLGHVSVVVALHGYGREGFWTRLLCGGANRGPVVGLAARLRVALPDYEVVDDLAGIPEPLRGVHPGNPVNRVAGGGVQLELPPRVRGLGPYWSGERAVPIGGFAPHTAALVGALATWAQTR